MRDTFTKIFPGYTHAAPTTYVPSSTHAMHYYPKQNDVGYPMPAIDRTFTHKMDFIKEYSESMAKIADMHSMNRH